MEIALKLIRHFWHFKWFLLGGTVLAAGLVVALTMNLERRYISAASLQLILPTNAGLTVTGNEYKQYEANLFFLNLLENVKSRKTLERVRLQLLEDALSGKFPFIDLAEVPELQADSLALKEKVIELNKTQQMLDLRDQEHIAINVLLEKNRLSLTELQGNVKAWRIGHSNFIDVRVETENPYKSTAIAETFMEVVLWLHEDNARQKIRHSREQLEALVKKAYADWQKKVKELEAYKIKHNIINLGEHTKAVVNQMVNLEIKLAHLRELKAAHKRAMQATEENLNQRQPQQSGEFTFHDQLIQLKDSLAQLQKFRFAANGNPDEEEKLLEQAIYASIGGMVESVPYDPSKAKQDLIHRHIGYELDKEMETQMIPVVQQELNRLTQYAARFAPLESAIEAFLSEIYTAQESYLILLNKLNLARTVEQGATEAELSVFAPPTLPRKPESTKRMLMVIAAGFGTFILMGGLVAARALLDTRIFTAAQWEFQTGSAPAFSVSTKENPDKVIRSLRKSLLEVSEHNRSLLLVSLSEQDYEKAEETLMQLLQKWEASREAYGMKAPLVISNQPIGNGESTFHAVTSIQTASPSEKQPLFYQLPEGKTPFEQQTALQWKEKVRQLSEAGCPVFFLPAPALSHQDWEEWASLAGSILAIRQGGQQWGEAEKKVQKQVQSFTEQDKGLLFWERSEFK